MHLFGPLAAKYTDALVRLTGGIVKRPHLPPLSARLVHLPCSEGGLGLRSWSMVADAASLASSIHCSRVFPVLFPSLCLLPPAH